MPEEPAVIAQVRLARSTWRLLLPPAILAAVGLLLVAAASRLVGSAATAALVAGGMVILVAILVAASLLSVRLEVDLAVLRLHWLGGERRYVLLRGPVTRIAVRGPSASQLRPRFGMLGWGLGAARLRNTEEIELIRLAPSRAVIAVPTDRGRVAIAPASEEELLAALAGAARVKQRLDEMTGRFGQRPAMRAEPVVAALAPAALTGIERALLEARLAAERAAAAPAETGIPSAPGPAEPALEPIPIPAPRTPHRVRPRPQTQWSRPGWMDGLAARRPSGSVLVTLVPVVASALVWAAAGLSGRLGDDTNSTRLLLLSVALAGPAATLGALMARAAWPRLVGLVLLSGLGALLLIGRSLIV